MDYNMEMLTIRRKELEARIQLEEARGAALDARIEEITKKLVNNSKKYDESKLKIVKLHNIETFKSFENVLPNPMKNDRNISNRIRNQTIAKNRASVAYCNEKEKYLSKEEAILTELDKLSLDPETIQEKVFELDENIAEKQKKIAELSARKVEFEKQVQEKKERNEMLLKMEIDQKRQIDALKVDLNTRKQKLVQRKKCDKIRGKKIDDLK